jgi:hypothetical protein
LQRLLQCKTQREVKSVSRTVFREITQRLDPQMINGEPISVWHATARVGDDGQHGDRGVYIFVNDDCTEARLGEGRVVQRLLDHIRAFAINESPLLRVVDPHWSVGGALTKLIRESIVKANRLNYVVLADGLTKEASAAGQAALFARFGLRRDGGFFINEIAS